jgi:hypothetical protein
VGVVSAAAMGGIATAVHAVGVESDGAKTGGGITQSVSAGATGSFIKAPSHILTNGAAVVRRPANTSLVTSLESR